MIKISRLILVFALLSGCSTYSYQTRETVTVKDELQSDGTRVQTHRPIIKADGLASARDVIGIIDADAQAKYIKDLGTANLGWMLAYSTSYGPNSHRPDKNGKQPSRLERKLDAFFGVMAKRGKNQKAEAQAPAAVPAPAAQSPQPAPAAAVPSQSSRNSQTQPQATVPAPSCDYRSMIQSAQNAAELIGAMDCAKSVNPEKVGQYDGVSGILRNLDPANFASTKEQICRAERLTCERK